MEILHRKEGNGVEYTGTVSDCDIFGLSKSRQQAHPKKNTRTTTRPMQFIYMDRRGTFIPPAKGEYRYVSKFSGDYSCMKEVYLLMNKSEAGESLHQYNITVAVPLELRIEIVRCDIGSEYIGKDSRHCASTLASPSSTPRPPRHIRAGYLRGIDRHRPGSPDA